MVDLRANINVAEGGHAEGDIVSDFKSVDGSTFAERLNGGPENNHLRGGGGNDRLNGRAGNDTLFGKMEMSASLAASATI